MKIKLHFCFFLLLFISTHVTAQKKDTTAKQVVEQGTKGDIILGKEIQKQQLSAPPQLLQMQDSVNKQPSAVPSKKKKTKQKSCGNKK